MATKTEKAVEVVNGVPVFDEPFVALSGDFNLQELIEENMGSDGLRPSDLKRVNFPRESAVWTIDDPSSASGVKSVDELTGVILSQTITRQFYAAEYGGGSERPDCFSADGLNGRVDPNKDGFIYLPDGREVTFGGQCVRCPLNEWGSDLKGGNGKACREYRAIALMEPDAVFPIVVRIPPTQLGIWRGFMADITMLRLRASQCVVSLALKLTKDRKPVIVPTVRGVLPEDTAAQISGVSQSMRMLAAPPSAPDSGYDDEGVPPIDDDELPF